MLPAPSSLWCREPVANSDDSDQLLLLPCSLSINQFSFHLIVFVVYHIVVVVVVVNWLKLAFPSYSQQLCKIPNRFAFFEIKFVQIYS